MDLTTARVQLKELGYLRCPDCGSEMNLLDQPQSDRDNCYMEVWHCHCGSEVAAIYRLDHII